MSSVLSCWCSKLIKRKREERKDKTIEHSKQETTTTIVVVGRPQDDDTFGCCRCGCCGEDVVPFFLLRTEEGRTGFEEDDEDDNEDVADVVDVRLLFEGDEEED